MPTIAWYGDPLWSLNMSVIGSYTSCPASKPCVTGIYLTRKRWSWRGDPSILWLYLWSRYRQVSNPMRRCQHSKRSILDFERFLFSFLSPPGGPLSFASSLVEPTVVGFIAGGVDTYEHPTLWEATIAGCFPHAISMF